MATKVISQAVTVESIALKGNAAKALKAMAEAKALKAQAEAMEKEARAIVLEALEQAGVTKGYAGGFTATIGTQNRTKFDTKAFEATYPEIAQMFTSPNPVTTLTVR